MIDPKETFGGTFPFEARFYSAPRARIHYVDEGRGRPILCLHGEPSWSYLYREIIPPLARSHRVIAPDFVGFGKSETPREHAYTPDAHIADLEALVLELDLRDITLVLHDWGGVIGGRVAARHPDRIARIVVTNAMLPLGLPIEADRVARTVATTPYFTWMRRLYDSGTMDTVLGEFGVLALSVMKGLQGVERPVDATWTRAYSAPFATPGEARGAIAFPKAALSGDLGGDRPGADVVAQLRAKPAMMIYGMADKVLIPEDFIAVFQAQFPGAPVHRLVSAGHFLQEDQPEAIVQLILQFMALTQTPSVG